MLSDEYSICTRGYYTIVFVHESLAM